MYIVDIARKNGIKKDEFEKFLLESNYPYKNGLLGMSLNDKIEEAVAEFKKIKAEEEEAIERERKIQEEQDLMEQRMIEEEQRMIEEEERNKRQALASMLITSGFSFDGYKITKYSGYISGDDAIQISRGTDGWLSNPTNVGASLMSSLSKIRRNAIAELKEAAYDLGCNAVIGVDFDYITLEPETANAHGGTTYLPYVFGVTANGNAVIIEKIDE